MVRTTCKRAALCCNTISNILQWRNVAFDRGKHNTVHKLGVTSNLKTATCGHSSTGGGVVVFVGMVSSSESLHTPTTAVFILVVLYMVLLATAFFRFKALSSSLRIDPNTSAQYLTIV